MDNREKKDLTERLIQGATGAMEVAELIVAIFLGIVVFIGIGYLFSQLYSGLAEHGLLNANQIYHLLDIVLVLFIVIELFRIAIAYVVGSGVMYAVVEAAFVAVGRKIVLFEYGKYGIYGALSLAILILVLVTAYYFLKVKKPVGDDST